MRLAQAVKSISQELSEATHLDCIRLDDELSATGVEPLDAGLVCLAMRSVGSSDRDGKVDEKIGGPWEIDEWNRGDLLEWSCEATTAFYRRRCGT
jgi:hypothetical protein